MSIHGSTYAYFETGCEGFYWCVEEDGKSGYDGLHIIKAGDHLRVIAEDGGLLFEGMIKIDTKTGYQPYPLNPKHGQQASCGFWVHWIQEGWEPDAWGRLFFDTHKAELSRHAQ